MLLFQRIITEEALEIILEAVFHLAEAPPIPLPDVPWEVEAVSFNCLQREVIYEKSGKEEILNQTFLISIVRFNHLTGQAPVRQES